MKTSAQVWTTKTKCLYFFLNLFHFQSQITFSNAIRENNRISDNNDQQQILKKPQNLSFSLLHVIYLMLYFIFFIDTKIL